MGVETEKQNVLCYLERERADWLPLHHRAERAGGMNAQANAEADAAMRRIDPLLEELHMLGGVALQGVEHATDRNI